MMKKILAGLTAAMLMACMLGAAAAQTLYVDNRETDLLFPERLNLRAQPASDGDLLGLYYSGTQVETLDEETVSYVKVSIAGMEGYMAKEYLITKEEAIARYGEDSAFFSGRRAQVELGGMWMTEAKLYSGMDAGGDVLASLANGELVELLGIIADDWAYVAAEQGGVRMLGYLPLDVLTDVEEYKALIIAGDKADSRVILYSWPNSKAKELMSLKNGTPCLNLFGRSVGGWRKVRVGGVTGWIREPYYPPFELLSETERGAIPYYPLLMQTKKDAILYSACGDAAKPYMTIGKDMRVEVLAECGEYAYIRTSEGAVGAYDRGDYGYMALEDLTLTQVVGGLGLAQVNDGDLPAVVLDKPDPEAELVGALCAGAQVRVTDFTQTDYAQVKLGMGEHAVTGYVLKSSLNLLTGEEGELSERIPQRATLLRDEELSCLPNRTNAAGAEPIAVSAGERVYMLGVIKGCAYVRAAGTPSLDLADETTDATGFIALSALNAPASTTHLTAFVNTDKVNMRADASVKSGIIGRARMGERLRVAEYGLEWCCVVSPDGTRGYMMTKYLEFEQK